MEGFIIERRDFLQRPDHHHGSKDTASGSDLCGESPNRRCRIDGGDPP